MRSFIAVVIVCIIALLFPGVGLAEPTEPGDSAAGSIGIRLGNVSESLADDPRAKTYIIDNIPPGNSITREIIVTNHMDAPVSLDLYAGPANLRDGSFDVEDRGAASALTSWISLEKGTVHLDPGQEQTVAVTIDVPANAPELEQYGVIWASTQQPEAEGGKVSLVSRVGVRVYLSVGAGNGPPSDFTITSLTPQRDADGGATVVANINNSGGRAVDLSGTLDLTAGPGGLTANTVSAKTTTIAPGDGGEVVFVLPNSSSLPAGPWQAAVKLESGFNKHDQSVELSFPDKGVGNAVGASSSMSGGAIAGIAIGAVVVLLVVIGASVYFLGNRRRAVASVPADLAGPGE